MTTTAEPKQQQFPCSNCGATLFWDPGSTSLKCPYCGTENAITATPDTEPVQELDFLAHLHSAVESAETMEATTVRCDGCGSEQLLRPGQTAGNCAFCGSGMVAQAVVKRVLKPRSLLPFAVTNNKACDAFTGWINGLWFAPSDLKRLANREGLVDPVFEFPADTCLLMGHAAVSWIAGFNTGDVAVGVIVVAWAAAGFRT